MKALYAGSFDPFTIGHLDIAKRCLSLFDSLHIGVGDNISKNCLYTVSERVEAIKKTFEGNSKVEVGSYSGLTVEYAKKIGANILIRGLRGYDDFDKEKNLADINKEISGIETCFLISNPSLSFISSSMIKELLIHGKDVSKYLGGVYLKLPK